MTLTFGHTQRKDTKKIEAVAFTTASIANYCNDLLLYILVTLCALFFSCRLSEVLKSTDVYALAVYTKLIDNIVGKLLLTILKNQFVPVGRREG